MLSSQKFEDFGVHAHEYYKIEHQVFKSNADALVLERLWNQYWTHTLSSSPLLHNQEQTSQSVINVVEKF
jgi:COP9 signalosome complex subunit 5